MSQRPGLLGVNEGSAAHNKQEDHLDEDASQILPLLQLNQDGNGGVR